MPGPVSDSYRGPPAYGPYVPHWCYDPPGPKECICGHHEGYHNDAGHCLHAQRGVDMSALDPEDYESIAAAFGIPHQLAQEIMYENDECDSGDYVEAHGPPRPRSYNQRVYVFVPTPPEQRFERMKKWIESNLVPVEDAALSPTEAQS